MEDGDPHPPQSQGGPKPPPAPAVPTRSISSLTRTTVPRRSRSSNDVNGNGNGNDSNRIILPSSSSQPHLSSSFSLSPSLSHRAALPTFASSSEVTPLVAWRMSMSNPNNLTLPSSSSSSSSSHERIEGTTTTSPPPTMQEEQHDEDDEAGSITNNWKTYEAYHVRVDPNQDDKALEIRLCQLKRPHMRAFHCAWFSFFNAFFVWFAIAPLQSEIRTSLKLSTQDLWTASIVGVGGTIVMRFLLGPLCDKYGSRILMSAVLCAAAIPCAMTGLVNSATGLVVLRLFIGVAGGAFVMCQYWTSRFFAKSVVGTANAMVAGWGNLGAGVTQLMVGSALFPLFKLFFSYLPPEQAATMAWRTVCVVPAALAVITGITILFVSDDCPYGQYKDLKKHGTMPEVSAATSFRAGAQNLNTWILFAHYACSFGVELTMYNASALYFVDRFHLSTSAAAGVASLYGWMLLFTRATGGYISDRANAKFGMRGRLVVHTTALLGEGMAILVFAHMQTLATTIVAMVFFSLFCQGASGAIFAIVPYIDPPATGSIAGIVGAGGSVGGVVFGLVFRQMAPDATSSFVVMGIVVLIAPILSVLIRIKGHAGLLVGKDRTATRQTLQVPEPHGTKEVMDEQGEASSASVTATAS